MDVSHAGPTATAWRSCIWLICLNIVLRGLWLAVMHPPQYFDFDWYFTHAVSMYHGQGYQMYGTYTAYWPMGYPYFLSILFRLTGPHVMAGLAANVFFSTGIVVLVYLLGLRLFAINRLAVSAAVGYTILPSQIQWNSVLGSEELFTLLALLSIYTYLSVGRTKETLAAPDLHPGNPVARFGLVALAGLLLGLACDVRPIPLLFPIALFVYEVWVRRTPIGRSLLQMIVFSVAMLIAICPLTIRNLIALHHFVLVSTNGGVNLWQGTKTNGSYYWSWNPSINPLVHVVKDQILENQIGTHVAIQYMLHHPFLTIVNGIQKIFFLYWVDWNVVGVTFAVLPNVSQAGVLTAMWIDTIAYWCWMVVAVYGLTALFRRRMTDSDGSVDSRVNSGVNWCVDSRVNSGVNWRVAALPLFFILYNTAVFFFFPAWDRFRYPMMPVWALFFGVGWHHLARRWRHKP